jgi:hypothetical protein
MKKQEVCFELLPSRCRRVVLVVRRGVGHLQFRSNARKVRVVMAYLQVAYQVPYGTEVRTRTGSHPETESSTNKNKEPESRLTRKAKRPFSFSFDLWSCFHFRLEVVTGYSSKLVLCSL